MVRIIFLAILAAGFFYFMKRFLDQMSKDKKLKEQERSSENSNNINLPDSGQSNKREPKIDDNEIGYYKIVKVDCKDGTEFEFISAKLPVEKRQVYDECHRLDQTVAKDQEHFRYFVKSMSDPEIENYKNNNNQ